MAPRRRRTMPSPRGSQVRRAARQRQGGWGCGRGGEGRGVAHAAIVCGAPRRARRREPSSAKQGRRGLPAAARTLLTSGSRPAAPRPRSLSGRRCDQPGQLSPHSRPGPHSAPQEGEDRGAVAVERLMGPGAPLKGAASRAELWILETDPDGGYPVWTQEHNRSGDSERSFHRGGPGFFFTPGADILGSSFLHCQGTYQPRCWSSQGTPPQGPNYRENNQGRSPNETSRARLGYLCQQPVCQQASLWSRRSEVGVKLNNGHTAVSNLH